MRRFARLFARSEKVRSIDLAEVDAGLDSADGRTVRLTALCVLEALAGLVER
jgi:formiminoglutamase